MGEPAVIDLAAAARAASARIAWSMQSDDLNVNLVVLRGGEEVAAHVNTEVDVLMIGVSGGGEVTVEDRAHRLAAGQTMLVPKGTRRAMRAAADGFAYLTCHRRRGGLMPRPRSG